ncbi:hypothetical protein MAM1_0176d07300 [Mucor ambiguus]|uniref:Uncharacterized protein n=1 Tax=Mucor ambiguus TaxID=91626 RepID=A0A0C9MB54_9FUNG|nr:hypothetical protein MAM1_0176d07300 [Mucor ambiguus]
MEKAYGEQTPHLAKNRIYTKKLTKEISNYVQHKLDPDPSAQVKWDLIKNIILRLYGKDPLSLKALLPPVHLEIRKIQEEKYNISKLRSGKRWMERNKNSPVYIKKTIDRRLDMRSMTMLKHPTTPRTDRHKHGQLIEPIPFEEILEETRRSPKFSSPGLDGIPYEFSNIITSQRICQDIITNVYNDTIKLGVFLKPLAA